MWSRPHTCKYCGHDTAYGDKHRECEVGSPEDQEMARRAMRGSPEDIYCRKGITVDGCPHMRTIRAGDESQDFCKLDSRICWGSYSNECKERGE